MIMLDELQKWPICPPVLFNVHVQCQPYFVICFGQKNAADVTVPVVSLGL